MIKDKTQKGFTIIEVVLVLAIAGLILMLALVAYPALQRSQRDTERKNMAATVASAVNSYASNNRGALPTSDTELYPYVPEVEAAEFTVTVAPAAGGLTFPGGVVPEGGSEITAGAIDVIGVYTKARCGEGENKANNLTIGSNRQFVVLTLVEAGGGDKYFCQNG